MDKKPTIKELEEILEDDSYDSIQILPDGSVEAYRSDETESVNIDGLKYQIKQWRKLALKFLPETNCDRNDTEAVENLISRLLAKQEKLLAVVEVLKFYAKPETYESETLDGIRITYTYPIEKDRGKKAREAIKALEE